ncbi:MAG: hypothetical protein A2847_02375 [Candidatus Sungbacteria bacterium RIFCSPHIGHO2_01_FULL_50_25]|uniref:Blue (type 1) copper domain-containing protein n=1 Tax=Candidatus Sungbacteria bacterium RIFCSPHIGHO2_01_FULL_50_25 TaxID=1802265 RepID=A0A1G2K9T2_9BACT|nr:MAG: hypothetical protein A2847_02375 [Candidatus Sungbacteria bacterium RIFCSPHIGHO2_01_FULL_50_25]
MKTEYFRERAGLGAPSVIIVVALILVLAGTLYYAISNYYTQGESDLAPKQNATMKPDTSSLVESGNTATDAPETKTFTITGKSFSFSQKEMRVKKGDTVKINFTSTEGFHDWVVDEFPGAKTGRVQTGQSTTAEFVASETGIFEYYCSVGSHRQAGMTGKLIVE